MSGIALTIKHIVESEYVDATSKDFWRLIGLQW